LLLGGRGPSHSRVADWTRPLYSALGGAPDVDVGFLLIYFRHVRFGSLADIAVAFPNVRFTPADSIGQRNTF
jgi:hypothetical protein